MSRSDAAAERPQLVPLTVISEVGILGVLALSCFVLSIVLLARRRRGPAWLPLTALGIPLLRDPWMWTSSAGMIVAALGFGGAIALSHESNVTEVVVAVHGVAR